MRVASLGYSNINTRQYINPIQKRSNSYGTDTISFSATKKSKKTSLLQTIKSLFSDNEEIKATAEAEQKDFEIKTAIGDMKIFAYEAKIKAKTEYLDVKRCLAEGEPYGYKGYIDLNENDGTKLLFGDINEKTGLPADFVKIKFGSDTGVTASTTLYDGLKLFTSDKYDDKNNIQTLSVINKKPAYYSEFNIKTGKTTEISPSKHGFTYFEGYKDSQGQITLQQVVAETDYKDPSKSEYQEVINGENHIYKFDPKKGMWIKDRVEYPNKKSCDTESD